MLQKKATRKPIHGNDSRLKSKYIDDKITANIEIFLLKFNFSPKKIYPKKMFIIGNIK